MLSPTRWHRRRRSVGVRVRVSTEFKFLKVCIVF